MRAVKAKRLRKQAQEINSAIPAVVYKETEDQKIVMTPRGAAVITVKHLELGQCQRLIYKLLKEGLVK